MIKKILLFLVSFLALLLVTVAIGIYEWKTLLTHALPKVSNEACDELNLGDLSGNRESLKLQQATFNCSGWSVQLSNIRYLRNPNKPEDWGKLEVKSLTLHQPKATDSPDTQESDSTPEPIQLPDIPELLKQLPSLNIIVESFTLMLQNKTISGHLSAASAANTLEARVEVLPPYSSTLKLNAVKDELVIEAIGKDPASAKNDIWFTAKSRWPLNSQEAQSQITVQLEQLPARLRDLVAPLLPEGMPLPIGTIRIINNIQVPTQIETEADKISYQIKTQGTLQVDTQGQLSGIHYQHSGDYQYNIQDGLFRLIARDNSPSIFQISNLSPEIEKLKVNAQEVAFHYHLNTQQVTVSSSLANISVTGSLDQNMRATDLSVTGALDQLKIKTQVSSHLNLPILKSPDIAGELLLDIANTDSLKASFSGTLNGLNIPFESTASYSFSRSRGKAKVDITQWNTSGLDLYGLFSNELIPIELTQGEVSFSSDISIYNNNVEHRGILTLSQLAGDYDGLPFTGLNIVGSISGDLEQLRTENLKLGLDEINLGFPVTQLKSQLDLTWNLSQHPRAKLHETSASLLGGNLKIPAGELNLNQKVNPLSLELHTLDLSQVLAIADHEGLSGSGQLSGTLPVNISTDGISIKNGSINNINIGTIIYKPAPAKREALISAGPHMEVLMDVLSKLDYDKINVALGYQNNGDTELQVHIEGQNPDYQNGQRVNFNPNFEINLPNMLTSLQLVNNISDKIERQVQKRYLNKNLDIPPVKKSP